MSMLLIYHRRPPEREFPNHPEHAVPYPTHVPIAERADVMFRTHVQFQSQITKSCTHVQIAIPYH